MSFLQDFFPAGIELVIFVALPIAILICFALLAKKLSEKSSTFSQWTITLSYLIFLPALYWFSSSAWILAPIFFFGGLIVFAVGFDTFLAKNEDLYHKNILGIFFINIILILYGIFHNTRLIYTSSGGLQEPHNDLSVDFSLLIPFALFGISWLYRSFYFKSYKLFIEFILATAVALVLVYFVLPNSGMIKYKLVGPKHMEIDNENPLFSPTSQTNNLGFTIVPKPTSTAESITAPVYWVAYNNSALNYQISHPSNWGILTSVNNPDLDFYPSDGGPDTGVHVVEILYNPNSFNYSLPGYVNSIKFSMPVQSNTNIVINGKETIQVVFTDGTMDTYFMRNSDNMIFDIRLLNAKPIYKSLYEQMLTKFDF